MCWGPPFLRVAWGATTRDSEPLLMQGFLLGPARQAPQADNLELFSKDRRQPGFPLRGVANGCLCHVQQEWFQQTTGVQVESSHKQALCPL